LEPLAETVSNTHSTDKQQVKPKTTWAYFVESVGGSCSLKEKEKGEGRPIQMGNIRRSRTHQLTFPPLFGNK
jgi:hypothetical protein